jgi:predicted enzyme related to lactoylglutathione lyase
MAMKKVVGIGGIFFKCENPAEVKEWYRKHLGIESDQYGATFEFSTNDNPPQKGFTAWSPFADTTTYFAPSDKDFMINYRVENLEELIVELRTQGVQFISEMEDSDFGKFIRIMDCAGNALELWEPRN